MGLLFMGEYQRVMDAFTLEMDIQLVKQNFTQLGLEEIHSWPSVLYEVGKEDKIK